MVKGKISFRNLEMDLARYPEVLRASETDGAIHYQRQYCNELNLDEPEASFVYFKDNIWLKLRNTIDKGCELYFATKPGEDLREGSVIGFNISIIANIDDELKKFLAALDEKAVFYHTHPKVGNVGPEHLDICPSKQDFYSAGRFSLDFLVGDKIFIENGLFDYFGIISHFGVTAFAPTRAFYSRLIDKIVPKMPFLSERFITHQSLIAFREANLFFLTLA